HAPRGVEPVDRFQQTDARHLDEILQRFAASGEPAREILDERIVEAHEIVARRRVVAQTREELFAARLVDEALFRRAQERSPAGSRRFVKRSAGRPSTFSKRASSASAERTCQVSVPSAPGGG